MGKNILLLDSDSGALHRLARALSASGYVPHTVNPQRDALEAFQAIAPEVVFIELGRPEAVSCCDGLRDLPEGATVPVIYVGDNAQEIRNPATALARGGDYYFGLPPR